MNSIIFKNSLKRLIPDKIYLNFVFKKIFGEKINFKSPKTFNEKLQWLKVNDRNPEYTRMVDKYEAKKYVANLIGEDYIIPTIGVYDSFDEIDFEKLPNQFVIKCTHDSGGLVVCKNKKDLNLIEVKNKINKSLKFNYYWSGREWPYKNVKPRIIIEEYMEDSKSKELIDYKIMCFNGKAKMSFTCSERYSGEGLKVTFFDLDWNRMPFERKYSASKKIISKPVNYDKMIEFSEKISKNMTFSRIDWYEINSKLYFGEITLYPGSGFEKFEPKEWDYKIGEMINLENIVTKK